jgi:hypothetical protein
VHIERESGEEEWADEVIGRYDAARLGEGSAVERVLVRPGKRPITILGYCAEEEVGSVVPILIRKALERTSDESVIVAEHKNEGPFRLSPRELPVVSDDEMAWGSQIPHARISELIYCRSSIVCRGIVAKNHLKVRKCLSEDGSNGEGNKIAPIERRDDDTE